MKNFRQPPQQNRPRKNMLVAGTGNVLDALQNGIPIDKIYINSKVSEKNFESVIETANRLSVPFQKVPIEKINSFNAEGHDGCIAVLSRIIYQDVQKILDRTRENGRNPLFLILDGITDVRNIGGIARSAYALGVDAIIIPEKGVGALNEDAFLTSAGALEKIPVCRVRSLMKTVDDLRLNGIPVYASDITAVKTIQEMDCSGACAIVMGGEEKGIYPALLKICDDRFKIPMLHGFDSLNVSVATGIILYEIQNQKRHSVPK